MNRKAITTIFATLATVCALHSQTIQTKVDYPQYAASTSNTIDISRIELTDNNINITFEMYGRANEWVSVSGKTYLTGVPSGKRYALISSQPVATDNHSYLPESGHLTTLLSFERADLSDTAFDLFESNGWQINGIELKEQSAPEGSVRCHVVAKIVDRPQSCRVLAGRSGTDWRVGGKAYPIVDGRVEFDLAADAPVLCEIVFFDEEINGAWRPTQFILEEGTVNITLYPQNNFADNTVEGGKLNAEYAALITEPQRTRMKCAQYVEYMALNESGEGYTDQAKELRKAIEAAGEEASKRDSLINIYQTVDPFTPRLKELGEELEAMRTSDRQKLTEQLQLHQSYATLAILTQQLDLNQQRIKYFDGSDDERAALSSESDNLITLYRKLYLPLYSGTVAAEPIERSIAAINGIVVGGHFVDFTAPDLDGTFHTLSTLIDGKIALLDMWASWCGPCIRNAVAMIPIYDKYADRGFTVVGVARENSSTDAMKSVIGKRGLPWLNLVELNDRAKLWATYGVGNAGGGTFLIDRDGTILAISPTPEEVEQILNDKLKQ